MPGHHVHLYAELGHREIVQYVLRTQVDLHWPVNRQVQLGVVNKHVVRAQRVIGIEAEWICFRHERAVDVAELAVRPWKSKTPVPLLAHRLDFHGVVRER